MYFHKEDLKRRYYTATDEVPSLEVIDKMISGSVKVQLFEGNTELDLRSKERHEALMDIQRSLTKLYQIFLYVVVLVETQGEKMDDIEENVANASHFILLVCVISMLAS